MRCHLSGPWPDSPLLSVGLLAIRDDISKCSGNRDDNRENGCCVIHNTIHLSEHLVFPMTRRMKMLLASFRHAPGSSGPVFDSWRLMSSLEVAPSAFRVQSSDNSAKSFFVYPSYGESHDLRSRWHPISPRSRHFKMQISDYCAKWSFANRKRMVFRIIFHIFAR